VANLLGSPVIVPWESELAAAGAAVQAAALFHGCGFDPLTDAWNLGAGDVIEPDDSVDHAAVRSAFAEATEKGAP
jgi:sugar (pentulose or hexulose) kinase